MHILIKNKKLSIDTYKVKCSIGKRGIKTKKKEGDFVTPKGNYRIKYILYRNDRIPRLYTKIKKYKILKNMGWCDDPRSNYYNKLIKFPFKYNAEKLYKRDNTYDIVIVLNFNRDPIKKNRGSAIFIHVAKKNYSRTLGCIGVKKKHLRKIIPFISKKTIVKII
tara:strand:+ start:972 stop:1463 length:492 start_codon:yes stop_codon:yes gene_type:complete